jgi:outer membrane protein assembly factor BamB
MSGIRAIVLPAVFASLIGPGSIADGAGASRTDAYTLEHAPGVERLERTAAVLRPPAGGGPPAASAAAAPFAGGGADWNNFGGNPQRNGITTVPGPDAAELLWLNTDDVSVISWHPVTLGLRAFAMRQSGFPQAGGPANDKLVAYDLETGEELWSKVVPYAGDPNDEWIAYVGGANGGRVYCARGGSGRTSPVHAYDAVTGAVAWTSVFETGASPQDGFVFAPDGDVVVCEFDRATRLDAADGAVVWSTPRTCPVSGNCGCAVSDTAAYIDVAAPGPANAITKIDLASGSPLYSTPSFPGFTTQNCPFLSADGSVVYFARSQDNPAVDFLYAFEDTGSALVELWQRPVRWTTSHEHGIGADGSLYTFIPGDEFVRLDPATGDVLDSAGPLSPIGDNLSPRTAVGSDGTVYVSNGWSGTPALDGRVWAFSADLSRNLFTLVLNRPNSGGPSLGQGGTLVVADLDGVYAYRTSFDPPTVPDGDVVPGNQLTVRKHPNGTDLIVRWDALTCTAADYHLVLGDLAAVASLTLSGAVCSIGTTGAAIFTPPAGSIFLLVAAENADGVEGGHGYDGDGAPRSSSAVGLCGITAQLLGTGCP